MRTKLLLAASLLALTGLLAGCSKNSSITDPARTNPPASSAEQAKVASTLASEPTLVEDGLMESADVTSFGALPGTFAAIQPLRFWRRITDVQRSYQFAFSDTDSTGRPTRAVVTVNKLLTGTFNIATAVPGDSDSVVVIHKPLSDRWVRRILLRRVPSWRDDGPEWRIVATSGVQVTSQGATTHVQSLRVQAPGLDTTLTDPLAFQYLRGIVRVNPGDQVTLTVTTQRNDDVVVTMMFGHRVRFQNNGDNTYTAVWTVPQPWQYGEGPMPMGAPVLHFGFDALSHGTLFDDTAPYDSQAWVLPFVIAPNMLADQEP